MSDNSLGKIAHADRRYIFSEQYREEIFGFWYQHRQYGRKQFEAEAPTDEKGRHVLWTALQRWITEYAWEDRANALDALAIAKTDEQLVNERIKMFEEHAQIGKEIRDYGLAYLRGDKGINSDMAALRAVVEGVSLERSSRGLAESLARLAQLDDDALTKEINKLLPAYKQVVDADFEDVTLSDETTE